MVYKLLVNPYCICCIGFIDEYALLLLISSKIDVKMAYSQDVPRTGVSTVYHCTLKIAGK